MPTPLIVYLRNHEAAGRAGLDLFRRVESSQRRRPYGDEIRQLCTEVREDLNSLRVLLNQAGGHPDRLLRTALQIGERVSRLKPNGNLLQRSPLSDLIEIEGLLDAVRAKHAGWNALEASGTTASGNGPNLDDLRRRAEAQIARLNTIHHQVAATVLQAPSTTSNDSS
jgi:hypothetical protein